MKALTTALALAAIVTSAPATAAPYGPCTVEDASSPAQVFPCRWDDGSGLAFTVYRASRTHCPSPRDPRTGEWSRVFVYDHHALPKIWECASL